MYNRALDSETSCSGDTFIDTAHISLDATVLIENLRHLIDDTKSAIALASYATEIALNSADAALSAVNGIPFDNLGEVQQIPTVLEETSLEIGNIVGTIDNIANTANNIYESIS